MNNINLKLNNNILNYSSLPYIIAEIGVNHEGSIKKAFHLIELAKSGGANAVKFQTYKADKIAAKKSPYYWDIKSEPTKTQYKLFQKYDGFEKKDYIKLAQFCKKIKIDFISTPFDTDAVDLLNPLVPFFKISSSDITNIPLLKKVSAKNKPIILSTGASNLDEIKFAVKSINKFNSKIKIALLHCILNYPTKNVNANLNVIPLLIREFPNCIIGYSDHTLPNKTMDVCTASYILGARIIEKHFTNNKKLKGNDHYHAMDEKDLKILKKRIEESKEFLGTENLNRIMSIQKLARKNARRAIYANFDIKKNEILSDKNLIPKRPLLNGISAVEWSQVTGKKAKKQIKRDTLITKKMFK